MHFSLSKLTFVGYLFALCIVLPRAQMQTMSSIGMETTSPTGMETASPTGMQTMSPAGTAVPKLTCMQNQTISFNNHYRGQAIRAGPGYNLTTFRGAITDSAINASLRFADRFDVSAAFDTANPNQEDLDLGAPNESCEEFTNRPGIGDGGKKGETGENCQPLGKVLIAHRDEIADLRTACENNCRGQDTSTTCLQSACQPNDIAQGSTFVFQFDVTLGVVRQVVLMDIGDPLGAFVQVGENLDKFVDGYGDNSITTIDFDEEDGEYTEGALLKIRCLTSCAVVGITWAECTAPSPEPEVTSPSPESFFQEEGNFFDSTSEDSVIDTTALPSAITVEL